MKLNASSAGFECVAFDAFWLGIICGKLKLNYSKPGVFQFWRNHTLISYIDWADWKERIFKANFLKWFFYRLLLWQRIQNNRYRGAPFFIAKHPAKGNREQFLEWQVCFSGTMPSSKIRLSRITKNIFNQMKGLRWLLIIFSTTLTSLLSNEQNLRPSFRNYWLKLWRNR